MLSTEYHKTDHFSGEFQEKGTWGDPTQGVTNAWDHPYIMSQTLPAPPKQCKHYQDAT